MCCNRKKEEVVVYRLCDLLLLFKEEWGSSQEGPEQQGGWEIGAGEGCKGGLTGATQQEGQEVRCDEVCST